MAIDVTTAAGRNELSRLAGSDEVRADLESIFSQAGSNQAIYQQFQTVFDRIAPADSFDKLSINRQSLLTTRAVREFLNQQAFDKRLKASLAGLSPALQQELTKKLGALGDYKITAQQRGRLLKQFERQKAKARRIEIDNNANTAKIGKFTVKGTLANIWETTVGRHVFAPLNRHVLQPIVSGHKTRMKQAGPFMRMLLAGAAIAGIGVFVVATGGLGIFGLAAAAIGTGVAANGVRKNFTEWQDARADALVAQHERDEAFRAQNDAYQNGNSQLSQDDQQGIQWIGQYSTVATFSGVRESDFAGSRATLNVRSGEVVLSPKMHNLYHGRVGVAFEQSGNLKILIADLTMTDKEIKQAIADVYADCTKGKAPESIMVRAGGKTSSFNTLEALSQAETNFAEEAERARLAAEAEAKQKQTAAWNQTAAQTIQENVDDTFLDRVIVQGLKTNGDEVEYERIALEALNPQLSGNPIEEKIYKEALGQKIAQRLETYGIKNGVGSSPAYLAAKAITDYTLNLSEGSKATKLQQIAKAVELTANSKSLSSDVRAIAALRAAGLDAQNTAAMIRAIREKTDNSVTLDDNVTSAVMALANENELSADDLKNSLAAIELAPAVQTADETQQEGTWDFNFDAFQTALAAKQKQAVAQGA